MTALEKTGEVITTDVLVIGGSISGAVAAIKARESNVDVLIVDKATVGWGGQAPLAGGGTLVVTPESEIDRFMQWLTSYGEYLNDQDWLRVMASETWDAVKMAAEWGAYVKKGDRPAAERFVSFQTNYLFAQMAPGNIEIPFKNKARKAGVRMMHKIAITDLIKDGDKVTGAVGFNVVDNKFHIFKAKATILAAGSCDFRTNRLCSSTGESVDMAYRAGAQLRNAEFNNLYAPGTRYYDIWADGIADEYFYNSAGENIREKYLPGETSDYRKTVLGMIKEVQEGRGPIVMDLSKMPEEDRDVITESFSIKEVKQIVKNLPPPSKPVKKRPIKLFSNNWIWETYKKVGIDPFKEKIEVWPSLQSKSGPIRVNLDAATTVTGLWAVGDSSVQGAGWSGAIGGPGQMHGAATAYCLVSGIRAGLSAARYASENDFLKTDPATINRLKTSLFKPMQRSSGISPSDIFYKVQEVVVPVKYNLLRTEERLKEALKKLLDIKQSLPDAYAKDGHYLCKYNEAKSMALCAEIIFKTALMRNETRGYHIREDYPQKDDKKWLKWIIVKQKNSEMVLDTEPVPLEKYSLKP